MVYLEFISAIVQAVVQGLTEFLPVSSSGHLALVQHFFGIRGEESILFTVALHLGTLLAVFVAFFPTIIALLKELFLTLRDLLTGRFRWKEMNGDRRMLLMLMIACLPLLPAYIVKDPIQSIASDNDIVIEGFCFLITGTMLLVADRCIKGRKTPGDITATNALGVGVAQCVALLPGVSRSGMTISGGLLAGFNKDTAVRFSFILGMPAVLAGSASELLDAAGAKEAISWGAIAIGMLVAAVVGFLSIKMVQWLLKTDRFRIFAFYTLILGCAVILFGSLEHFGVIDISGITGK